jgi:CBS domain-containing protein
MKTLKELFENKSLYTVSVGTTVYDTAKYMTESNIGLVPVLDHGRLVGVFSERDLMTRVIAKDLDVKKTKVEEVMTKEIVVAHIDDSYEICLQKMKDANIRHIIVIEDNILYGVVSIRDLLEIDISVHKETIDVLQHYIYSR